MKLKKLWPYNYNDKRTWKYSTCEISGRGNDLYVSKWVLNPHFIYKKLDPTYPAYLKDGK